MSENETKPVAKKASASTDETKTAQPSADSVQAAFDEANEKGYVGTVPDETPNEAYTVAGVTKEATKDGK